MRCPAAVLADLMSRKRKKHWASLYSHTGEGFSVSVFFSLSNRKQKSGSWQRHKTAHGLQLLTEPVRFTCMISIPEKKNGPLFSRKRFTICLPWKIQVFMFLAMVHRRYSIPWKTVIFCGKKKTAIFPRTLFVPPKDGYWRSKKKMIG